MRTICRRDGSHTSFVITEVDPAYHQTLRNLGYGRVAEGFAKTYPAGTPGLESIYRNFERHAERMVLQAARAQPVPWEEALLAFLKIVEGAGLEWWLCGSAALAVRGLDVRPGDVDLKISGMDVRRLNDLMLGHLVEPLVPVEGWVCGWWSRAFLYARLEWMGAVSPAADEPDVSDYGPEAELRAETIIWRGYALRVPPLDL